MSFPSFRAVFGLHRPLGLPAACLAACLLCLPAGCSDPPTGPPDSAASAESESRAVRAAPASPVSPAVGMAAFRERQRADRELLDGRTKERRDEEAEAVADTATEAETDPEADASPPAIMPAAKKTAPWTIAMVPSRHPEGSLDRAREQFRHFTGLWLERIRDNMRFSARRAEIVQGAEGFLARFSRLDADSRQLEVKPTDTAVCPFVGVLKYLEHHYEAGGPTPDQAAAGPFRRVKTVRVTEIFRYAGDAWVH